MNQDTIIIINSRDDYGNKSDIKLMRVKHQGSIDKELDGKQKPEHRIVSYYKDVISNMSFIGTRVRVTKDLSMLELFPSNYSDRHEGIYVRVDEVLGQGLDKVIEVKTSAMEAFGERGAKVVLDIFEGPRISFQNVYEAMKEFDPSYVPTETLLNYLGLDTGSQDSKQIDQ